MANAEGEAVKLLTASLPPGEAAMYLLGLKYLEALPSLAQGKGSTIFRTSPFIETSRSSMHAAVRSSIAATALSLSIVSAIVPRNSFVSSSIVSPVLSVFVQRFCNPTVVAAPFPLPE